LDQPGSHPLEKASVSQPVGRAATGQEETRQQAGGVPELYVGSVKPDETHLGAALREYAAGRASPLATFTAAAFADAQESRRALERQIDACQRDRESLQERLTSATTRAAVLDEKLRAATEGPRLRHWVFGVGGILAGTGLPLAVQQRTPLDLGGLLVVLGGILMWVSAPRVKG
jgi:hypothetical protein